MESSATKKKNNSNNNNGPRRTQSSLSNSSSKRFLLCFKPLVHTHPNKEESGRLNRSKTVIGSVDEPLFAYVPMGNTEELPTLMSSASSNSDKTKDKEGDVPPKKKKKKKKNIHQMFSKILKTFIPHSSLTKKILRQKDNTKSSIPKGSDKYFNHFEIPIYQNGKLLSNASSNSSSRTGTTLSGSSSMSSNQRSSLSSASTSSNSNEWKDKHDIQVRHIYGKASFDSNNGFCLLFMSLLVLILWGKVCAIFCTSIWLFLVPRYLNGNDALKNNLSPIFETEDRCNKTVVMEGLLERTRSHVLQHL